MADKEQTQIKSKDDLLEETLKNIVKTYGKGSVMKMGEQPHVDVNVIPSGSLLLNQALGVGGFNVTMPCKREVLNYVDEITPAAKLIGASNTVVITEEGKLYLSPIKDMCTGEIISYTTSASPTVEMVMRMLKDAITKHPVFDGLVIHSDQGFQYQHAWFVNCLEANDITQSMSRKGNCLDNSKMETFFSTLKKEMYYGHEKEFKTREQLIVAIDEYIDYYNKERIQMKLGYLPPLLFREKIA